MSDREDPSPVFTPVSAMVLTLFGNAIFVLTLIGITQATGLYAITYVAIATIVGYGVALALSFPFIEDPPGPSLGFRTAPPRAFVAAVLFVPSILIASELENVFADFAPRPPPPEGTDESSLSKPGDIVAVIATLALALPLVYQTFFYGLIQPRLERFWGAGGAVAGTALLAACGMSSTAIFSSHDPLVFVRKVILMIGPALLYGLLRRSSASVYPGIVTACGIGLLSAIASVEGYEIQGFTTPAGGHTPTHILVLPAVMVGIGLGLCRHRAATPPEATDPASDTSDTRDA